MIIAVSALCSNYANVIHRIYLPGEGKHIFCGTEYSHLNQPKGINLDHLIMWDSMSLKESNLAFRKRKSVTFDAMQRYLKNLWWELQNWPHIVFFIFLSALISSADSSNLQIGQKIVIMQCLECAYSSYNFFVFITFYIFGRLFGCFFWISHTATTPRCCNTHAA